MAFNKIILSLLFISINVFAQFGLNSVANPVVSVCSCSSMRMQEKFLLYFLSKEVCESKKQPDCRGRCFEMHVKPNPRASIEETNTMFTNLVKDIGLHAQAGECIYESDSIRETQYVHDHEVITDTPGRIHEYKVPTQNLKDIIRVIFDSGNVQAILKVAGYLAVMGISVYAIFQSAGTLTIPAKVSIAFCIAGIIAIANEEGIKLPTKYTQGAPTAHIEHKKIGSAFEDIVSVEGYDLKIKLSSNEENIEATNLKTGEVCSATHAEGEPEVECSAE